MRQPRWIDRAVVLAIHDEQLAEHGGLPGLQDEGALDAALMRPQQKFAYEADCDLALIAAAYAYGLARNHPFADGNQRTALIALELALALNGCELLASDEDCIHTMLALAAGELDEGALAAWIRTHMMPRRPPQASQ